MKLATVIVPILLPRLSDLAAVQLTEILAQLLALVEHHYGPQIERWQRRQRARENETSYPPCRPLPFDSLF